MGAYLELSRLTKIYPTPQEPVAVVEDFDLKVDRGEFLCLIGHSGCGKSTVLSMLAALIDVSGGGMILDGREVVGPGPDRGVVFQSPNLLPWLTAFGNVMLGVDRVYPHVSRAERASVAEYYLAVLGLGDSMHRYPRELSQGMQQRVGIARAFALSPKMLLLDEPFGMLDSLTRMDLQHVLLDLWNRTRLTALMVTHDVDEALFLADRVVMMTNGPRARVGGVLQVPFERPRERRQVLGDARYYELRERLMGFLESEDHKRTRPETDHRTAIEAA